MGEGVRRTLCKAAEKAARAFAVREALRALRPGSRGCRPSGRADGSGRRQRHPRGEGGAVLRRERVRPIPGRGRAGESLAREAGDPAREAKALAAIGWAEMWARDLEGPSAHAREAIAVAGPGGGDTVARAQFTIGFVRAVTGRSRRGQERDHRALATGLASRRVDRAVPVAVRRRPPEELGRRSTRPPRACRAKASPWPGSITCSSPSSSTSFSTG